MASQYVKIKSWYPVHGSDDVEGQCIIAYFVNLEDVEFKAQWFKCHHDDVESTIVTTFDELTALYRNEIDSAPRFMTQDAIAEFYAKYRGDAV